MQPVPDFFMNDFDKPKLSPKEQKSLDRYNAWTRFMAMSIGRVAPGLAINYVRRRNALASYSAATLSGPNQAWRPTNKTADEIIKTDHAMLRARARSLVRNSSHVAGAMRKITNNVVYKGIRPQSENETAEKAWKEWADAVKWHEIETLVVRHWWQDGEIFVHYYPDQDLADAGLIPLGVELLECDHLDTTQTGPDGDGRGTWKQGILLSPTKKPLGYQLYPEHPGDSAWISYGNSVFLPSLMTDHLFLKDRISQHRGVPWLHSIIMEMRDFSEFQSNERLAQRLMSAFGIFLKTVYPEHIPSGAPLGGTGDITIDDVPDYIEPARVQALPPGVEPYSVSYDRPGRTYEPFVKTSLRGVSTGINMSYEAFTNDYTDASYSSARSASLEERRGYQVQQLFLVNQLHQSAWRRLWFMNSLTRTVPGIPEVVPVEWQFPGWPWVDPDKDSKAAERDIKNGIDSRHEVVSSRGKDYGKIQADLDKEEKDGFPKGGDTTAINTETNTDEN